MIVCSEIRSEARRLGWTTARLLRVAWKLSRGITTAALFLLASPILAQEPPTATGRWEARATASWVTLGGSASRTTGGLMSAIGGQYVWLVGERLELGVGAGLGLFAFAEPHWMGVLGGPSVTAALRPVKSFALGLGFNADFGRVSTCNIWGYCARFNGFYPALSAQASYDVAPHVAIEAALHVRIVETWAWSGPSVAPSAGAVFSL